MKSSASDEIMAQHGRINKDRYGGILRGAKPSRGWFISSPCGIKYLYRDGKVRFGVYDSESSAFWPDAKSAHEFFDAWKSKILNKQS